MPDILMTLSNKSYQYGANSKENDRWKKNLKGDIPIDDLATIQTHEEADEKRQVLHANSHPRWRDPFNILHKHFREKSWGKT